MFAIRRIWTVILALGLVMTTSASTVLADNLATLKSWVDCGGVVETTTIVKQCRPGLSWPVSHTCQAGEAKGDIVQSLVLCPNDPVTVVIPFDSSDLEEKIIKLKKDHEGIWERLANRHIFRIRVEGIYAQIPAREGRDDMWAVNVAIVNSFPSFFSEDWGFEAAFGTGIAHSPNGDKAFMSTFESGVLYSVNKIMTILAGYQYNGAVVTYDEVTLKRHTGILRLRLQLWDHWAIEIPGTIGWGTQLVTRESEWIDANNVRWVDTERWTPDGCTWSLGIGVSRNW